ncbi:unnamed protein product [Lactuca saligna]|uniref:Uncharacterized protein n=1 Tax=Lactuca saligna TaxID=75948 RepID=A0AA36EEM4_LACSI|nr:unnamed protein product [Lactuca saligna]
MLIRNKRDKELDRLLFLQRELEEKEVEDKIAKVTRQTQESLFTPWTLERIQCEAINDPNIHWLEIVVSFELGNTADSHFDFSVTPREILFQCFKKIERDHLPYYDVNHMFFSFYLKYGNP